MIPLLFIHTVSISTLPAAGAAFVLLMLLTVGLSLLTSALNVRYRDINFFVQAILIIWFYATPIVYSLRIIPGEHVWLWNLNPLTAVIELFQYSFVHGSFPHVSMLITNAITAVVFSVIGTLVFHHESKNFDDWV
ncbi:MAG: ABC transporter permease [Patescibacteria group bacterium]|nr:ABC transporter permease [Patescibacteria group bacterium]